MPTASPGATPPARSARRRRTSEPGVARTGRFRRHGLRPDPAEARRIELVASAAAGLQTFSITDLGWEHGTFGTVALEAEGLSRGRTGTIRVDGGRLAPTAAVDLGDTQGPRARLELVNGGEGYFLEVKEDGTLLVRGRDFERGLWLPSAQFVVEPAASASRGRDIASP